MSKNNTPEIIKVNSVREEYEYVREQICEKCNQKGSYNVELQRLVMIRGFPCDDLDCVCTNCGHKKTYVFDVTIVFEGYKKKFGTEM